MAWPTSTDYYAAVQHLRANTGDEELRGGEAARTPRRKLLVWTGNFADVYRIDCPATGDSWALKCFTREVPGLEDRYRLIAAHLQEAKLPFTVDFQWLEQGLRIHGHWFPALKMRWVEGLALNQYVEKYLDQPQNLRLLLGPWVKLAAMLREAEIAHADLQHGNVLLVPTGDSLALRLIDYDGMWVPALAGSRSGEVGHPAYQHPQRLREGTYNAHIDRFSHLAIYTAIRCLVVGRGELWRRFSNGENLLFRERDFRNPGSSQLFHALWELDDMGVRPLVGRLILACRQPLEEVPWIDELVGNLPVPTLTREEESAVVDVLASYPYLAATLQDRQQAEEGAVNDIPAVEKGEPADKGEDVSLPEAVLHQLVAAPPPAPTATWTLRHLVRRLGCDLIRPVRAVDRSLEDLAGEGNNLLHNFLRVGAIVTTTAPVIVAMVLVLAPMLGQRQGVLVFSWSEQDRREMVLLIDGEQAEIPDQASWEYRCLPGNHEIRATRDGFAPWESTFVLGAGQRMLVAPQWQSLPRLVLVWPRNQRDQAVLTIDEKPHDLSVATASGEDRIEFLLTAGRHEISIRRPGFEEFRRSVDVPAGEKQDVTPSWRPLPAVYRVQIDPPGAELVASGKGVRLEGNGATRTVTVASSDGERRVVLIATMSGYEKLEQEIRPHPGETGPFVLRLRPSLLRLRPISSQTVEAGGQLAVALSVEGAEELKGKLRFSLEPKSPPGSEIKAETGEFTWAPAKDQPAGTHDVVVSVKGPEGRTGRTSFAITVTRPTPPSPKEIMVTESPRSAAKEIAVDLGGGVTMEMVLIPAGSFLMGSLDSDSDAYRVEKPQHQVRITKPFYLARYEVTQEQWQALMGENPSRFKSPKNPVDTVSWHDCQAFMGKLNEKYGRGSAKFSLPTEAQWEYACRAGSATHYGFGDDENNLGKYGWYDGNARGKTHPVGEKKPNPWGMYDMHGNVWEWCADGYDPEYYATSPTDNPGSEGGFYRVARGGCWGSLAGHCRSASRANGGSGIRGSDLGLRVSRVVAE